MAEVKAPPSRFFLTARCLLCPLRPLSSLPVVPGESMIRLRLGPVWVTRVIFQRVDG